MWLTTRFNNHVEDRSIARMVVLIINLRPNKLPEFFTYIGWKLLSIDNPSKGLISVDFCWHVYIPYV